MQINKVVQLSICAVILCAIFGPTSRADTWNEKTTITFKDPVEIPGKALPAGTYVFQLANSQSDRHIVEIWNADQTELIATVLAIADYRLKTPQKTILHFDERSCDAPMALDSWFYSGDNTGQQFVYQNSR